ncbi:MAG: limonene-1,2-epoxide hydrolase family protein [Vicinamibacterales bacterium]
MSPSEIVTAFITAIEAKDIEAAVALAAENISYENMPTSPIVGHPGLTATLQAFLEPAAAVEWQILEQWEVGRVVINERLDRFQVGTGWLELPIAGVFTIDDDNKIAVWRDYFDMGTYTRQFAALTSQ